MSLLVGATNSGLGGSVYMGAGDGAGAGDDPSDGLVRFKKGFANHLAASGLCGAILDAEAYQALSADAGDGGFFPAYRGVRKVERSDEH